MKKVYILYYIWYNRAMIRDKPLGAFSTKEDAIHYRDKCGYYHYNSHIDEVEYK